MRAPAPETQPATERPAEPAEKTERPASREKEAEPGKQPDARRRKSPAKARARAGSAGIQSWRSLGLVALLLAAAAGYLYWDHTSHFESTDDAFIAARQFAIAPKVAGYVTAVPVTDNQHVDKGERDRADRPARLPRGARAGRGPSERGRKPASTTSTRRSPRKTRRSRRPRRRSTQAQANLELAKVTWGRDKPLVNQGWATAQQGTIDVQNLKAQQATVDSAQATLKVAQRQIDTLKAQRASAEANLAQAQAQRDQAELNLSYTTVIADQPGRVVNLTGAVGQYAQAGTNLTHVRARRDSGSSANYKETQLDRMRPGQPVDIEIDAYPERDFHGHLDSVQPGSGPAFSLLPPENATGNYVKIVQRVPVKIILDNPPTDVSLGPGMSVVPTVRVDPSPSLYERLKARVEQWRRRV